MRVLHGESVSPPPIWLMRQAGRYLPEYRAVREQAGGFLELCYNPELAAEVTLQPLRRFDFDAAILFSDILVVADALGQKVWFEEGHGPRLEPINASAQLGRLDPHATAAKFGNVYETVSRLSEALDPQTGLIGFCGGPWTVATYMVAGRSSTDQAPARLWAYTDPKGFGELIDIVTEVSADYLCGQIEAGAQAVQIFESWASVLPDEEFARWVIAPTVRIVERVRERHPGTPIIGFPRGAGPLYLDYLGAAKVDCLGCDTSMPLDWIGANLQPRAAVQGNLDPLLLVAGGDRLAQRVDAILAALSAGPFIFNLGHGIVPQTPPEHVAALIGHIRGVRPERRVSTNV
jgi:uroporphyrinogen decarboxylase